MFRATITSTPFAGNDEANIAFEHISARNTFSNDITFISTLRALLANRIPEGESVRLQFTSYDYGKHLITPGNKGALLDNLIASRTCDGKISIINFNNRERESVDSFMLFVKENFDLDGWEQVEKVTKFFEKSFSVLCYINRENKSVILYTGNIGLKEMHYLQCGIFAFMPWYFNPEDGVSDDEMALIESLRKTNSREYINCLVKLAQQYNLRDIRLKRLLSGFELRHERAQSQRIECVIQDILRDIETYNDRIFHLLCDKRDNEIQLSGLKARIRESSEEDSEVMDYFLCNKKLHLVGVNDNMLRFVVGDYLSNFDPDMAETMIENTHSYVYGYTGQVTQGDMHDLMTAIFVDQKLKIKFCAAYEFSIPGNVSPIGRYDFDYHVDNYLPNPHVNEYRCMGDYLRVVNESLANNDYVGAIEQCVASCKSLNFADSVVMESFMRHMYESEKKFIELPDGEMVSPVEAVEWLKG